MDELNKKLEGYEDVPVFVNPDYLSALIGVSTDNQAVYDYEKMIDFLVEKENMTPEEAEDFICYNTLRTIPYMGENHPVVIRNLE